MNRDKIGTQTCYVHQHTFVSTHDVYSMSMSQSCLFIFMQSLYYTSRRRSITVKVCISELTEIVKAKIYDNEGIPLVKLSLMFAGRELEYG